MALACAVSALGAMAQAEKPPERHVEVIRGEDGWLFHGLEFESLCHSKIPMTEIVRRLVRFASIVEHSGRKVAIVVTFNKSAIYPERLGPATPLYPCANAKRQELRAALAAQNTFPFLDLYSALMAAKPNSPPLWYPNDMHWQPRGMTILTKLLIENIAPGLWDQSDIHLTTTKPHVGDLGRMIGDTKPIELPTEVVGRPSIKTSLVGDVPAGVDGRAWQHYEAVQTAAGGPVPLAGNLFMIHDSLGSPWVAQFFRSTTFARWAEIISGSIPPQFIADAIAASDVVVFEAAEQTLPYLSRMLSDSLFEKMEATLRENRNGN
jgi:SGNH hydrolase-like domain, acetyltransferase AlgX